MHYVNVWFIMIYLFFPQLYLYFVLAIQYETDIGSIAVKLSSMLFFGLLLCSKYIITEMKEKLIGVVTRLH